MTHDTSNALARLRKPRQARSLRPAPEPWAQELKGVLLTARQIRRRVHELARVIAHDYEGKELLLVPLLSGSVVFLADLLRYLKLPLYVDFIGVSSYGSETSPGQLTFTKEPSLPFRDRHVLVIDDILDTGQTLQKVLDKLRTLGPRSLRTCVLLDKPQRRKVPIQGDYVGFQIPNAFVVGYGLDFAERYRNLPFIGVIKETNQSCPEKTAEEKEETL